MTYDAALKQLDSRGWFRIKPGLERLRTVLKNLGNPQNNIPSIHVAGTNGKGSVVASLESVLRHAGYRTGLYISPHLKDVRERIQMDGSLIPTTLFADATEEVLRAEKNTGILLTSFELLTAIAFVALGNQDLDILILETGMGGLWDATNAVAHPMISVITSIGKDHERWLGRTEAAIARQKAGIIKRHGLVISGVQGPGKNVIAQTARRKRARLLELGTDFSAGALRTYWTQGQQTIRYQRANRADQRYAISLLGSHQVANAAIVLAAVDELRRLGWELPERLLSRGLQNVVWPGRFQIVSERGSAPMLYDGAHNPAAMRRLLETLKESTFENYPKTFVFSAYKDKDYREMARLISPWASQVMICPLAGPRGLSTEQLRKAFAKKVSRITGFDHPQAALDAARQSTPRDGVIIITGSLALVGQLLPVSAMRPSQAVRLRPIYKMPSGVPSYV